MDDPIELGELNLHAVACETEDFSAVSATFRVTERNHIAQVRQAAKHRAALTLRCGMLEVEGVVGKLKVNLWGTSANAVMLLDDIRRRALPEKRGLRRPPHVT